MEDLIADEGEAPDEVDMAEVRRAMRAAEAQALKDEDINPEELQKYLKERFAPDRVAAYIAGDEGEVVTGAVSQQALMPTARDPKLWVVRCGDGQERELIVSILQKSYDYFARGVPLLIKSAFAKDSLKGFIYVEAYKESHVREALKGLRGIFHSKPPKLVPLSEMVSAVSVEQKSERIIRPGSWVRVRNGLYKGDLGRVSTIDANVGRAVVKLLPRLDYGMLSQRKRLEETRASLGKQPKMRPPPKPFNVEEAKSHGLDLHEQRDRLTGDIVVVLNGTQRFFQGYVIKQIAMKSLIPEKGIPPLEELQRFNAAAFDEDGARGGARDDLEALVDGLEGEGVGALEAATLAKARFDKGDRVKVVDGDLAGIVGQVEHVTDDGLVLVHPKDEQLGDFKEAISFQPKELRKYFENGDHVRIVAGEHDGASGLVVSKEGDVCIVLTDATQKEIRVLARDLTQAVAAASAEDSFGEYTLFDLVQLTDSQVAGLIVGIEKDMARVLSTRSRPDKQDIRLCKLQDIQRKLVGRRATATDQDGNEVSINDIVEVTAEGELNGSSGTVKEIAKGCLFLQSKHVIENGGYVCVNARFCRVRGGKSRVVSGHVSAPLATPSRSYATSNMYGDLLASPARNDGLGSGPMSGGFGGASTRGHGAYSGRQVAQQDRLLEGKSVRIRAGPYRGMKGTVKNATATHMRVELEAQYKVVSIPRSCIDERDGGSYGQAAHLAPGLMGPPGMISGPGMGPSMRPIVSSSSAYGAPVGAPGGRTPGHWSQVTATPAHYSMAATTTPLHPGMTPGRDVTKTPAHDPAWTMTPAYTGFGTDYRNGSSYAGSGDAAVRGSNGMDSNFDASFGPVSGSTSRDWIGLEIQLLNGDRAVVRSVTPENGMASVQIGEDIGDGNRSFRKGPVRAVLISDMQLSPIMKDDKIKVLTGELKGKELVVSYSDQNTLYCKGEGSNLLAVEQKECGKLAGG